MPLDPDLVEAVRELDEHQLRRLLMLARARLEGHGVSLEPSGRNVRFRRQHVKCGKQNCTRCPHGPYWYAYWWENGSRRSAYVGKLDDSDVIPDADERSNVSLKPG